ncbi:MAG: Peptidase family M48 [uncultured Aureispira sp.]|uniref:Peptidase family M48 n=1 Tax=uncultured Aureispira sp. TaxID=1331704 RepID=A0A6S6SUC5_9BACT|nr:MAG: Peptidase family M48 [uncultured Aureispira sp.]
MTKLRKIAALLLFVAIFQTACDRPVNVFTVSQDKELGAQLEAEIASDPAQYPLLSEVDYPDAYAYLLEMRDEILASPEVKYKTEFEWKLKIIDDDVLNAFCAPGGYIYVYTGLMKYLEKSDHLAGVLAHEIAHADQRHSSASMTEQYGIETLVAIASQNATAAQLSQVAGGLTQLGFSRAHETDADDHSVDYLQSTKYACDGASGFFAKLIATGQTSGTPAFMSTHPDPGNRVTKITERADELGCSKALHHDDTSASGDNGAYNDMLATLPQ